jgi:hypothetical protein
MAAYRGEDVDEREASFATTPEQREQRRAQARELVGLVLECVRYVEIDYHRCDYAPDHSGPRPIVDEKEWFNPSWRYDGFDSVDHGVELETADSRIFTITWDSPGRTEGISIRERPLIGYAVIDEADVAVWDVTTQSGWSRLIGKRIDDVAMHYFPWESPLTNGFWCPRITLTIDRCPVHLILGEVATPTLTLRPSADNVAVLFPPHVPPSWASGSEPAEDGPTS